MTAEKRKTINVIKEKRTVNPEVQEKRKEYVKLKKLILKALESGEKTIPQIAEEINIPIGDVTFTLMSLRKYGDVETGEIDDMDEYYFYNLKKK
ncbi:MAG: hypothetical protein K8S00_09430 [Bacteroidales bacterium]|nr:hypothetical protein [Bacteroidales bacterium]